jgi:hypothetical protein
VTTHSTDEPRTGRSGPALSLIVLGVILAVLAAFAVIWVIGIRSDESAQDTSGRGVAPSDILGNASAFVGKDVMVVAPVSEIVEPIGFTLEGGLLVIGIPNGQVQQAMQEDWSVTVVGTVRDFDPVAAQRATGGQVPPGLANTYQGKPMLVSTRVAAGEGS